MMLPTLRTRGRKYFQLSLKEVSEMCYLHETTGRAGWLYDQQKDKNERCDDKNVIVMRSMDEDGCWTEEAWWEQLEQTMYEVQCEALPRRPLDETATEHYERRQQWLSSGSSGGKSILVPEAKK
jgi:hypothetical protein